MAPVSTQPKAYLGRETVWCFTSVILVTTASSNSRKTLPANHNTQIIKICKISCASHHTVLMTTGRKGDAEQQNRFCKPQGAKRCDEKQTGPNS